nr:hypothetical protein BCU62_16285 [Enterovibrio norvegicus]
MSHMNTIIGLLGIYIYTWAIPCLIFVFFVSFGNLKYIIYIDKKLSKSLDVHYDNSGNMVDTMFATIMNRFLLYSISFPFIFKRADKSSFKLKTLMWFTSIGWWCVIITISITLINKV